MAAVMPLNSASPSAAKKSNTSPPLGTAHPPAGSAPIARSCLTVSSIARFAASSENSPTGLVKKNGPCSPTKYCAVRTWSVPPARLKTVPSLTVTLVTSLGFAIAHLPFTRRVRRCGTDSTNGDRTGFPKTSAVWSRHHPSLPRRPRRPRPLASHQWRTARRSHVVSRRHSQDLPRAAQFRRGAGRWSRRPRRRNAQKVTVQVLPLVQLPKRTLRELPRSPPRARPNRSRHSPKFVLQTSANPLESLRGRDLGLSTASGV